MVSHVFEDLRKRKAPNSSPRDICLFLRNKFRLRYERRPLAEGPKKHLPFARIVNRSESWDPLLSGVLCIYTEASKGLRFESGRKQKVLFFTFLQRIIVISTRACIEKKHDNDKSSYILPLHHKDWHGRTC